MRSGVNISECKRPTRSDALLVVSLLAILAALLSNVTNDTPATAAPQFDRNTLIIADSETGSVVLDNAYTTQSFKIINTNDTPACDATGALPHKYAKIEQVDVKIHASFLTQVPPGCYYFSDLKVSIQDQQGEELAAAFITYTAPTPVEGVWYTAEFPKKPLLLPDTTYYLVLQHLVNSTSSSQAIHAGIHSAHALGTPVSVPTLGAMNNSGSANPTQSPACPQSPPPGAPIVSWLIDNRNPYADGTLNVTAADGLSKITYLFVHKVNVIALIYDPPIGQVAYTDELSSIKPVPTANYSGALLHTIVRPPGNDPRTFVDDIASSLSNASAGTVEYQVEIYPTGDTSDWSPHLSGPLAYSDGFGQVINIPSFIKWTANTWPCYPHIPNPDSVQATPRARRVCYPQNIPAANYPAIFAQTIRDGKSLTTLANEHQVDDVWLFTDETARTFEAVMAVGNSQLRLGNASPVEIPNLQVNVPVMGFNWQLGLVFALHSHGHRAETIMASLYNGNLKPTCLVNKTENNHFNHFTRIYDCYEEPGTPIPPGRFGSIGTIHKVFNVPVPAKPADRANPTQVSLHRNDLGREQITYWPTPAQSDADDWLYNFPNFTGQNRPISCNEYGCNGRGYYEWWFGHLPRYRGLNNGMPNNVWPYISSPGCFANIPNPRDSLTPVP